MITNTGKAIIGKYMLGQAPAYASHIAIGCGKKPFLASHTLTVGEQANIQSKENLDFEMLRVPISSRGFINDNGTNKLVLTAELPSEERYEITEVGIFSAGSNNLAGAYDSKLIFGFTDTENWQYDSGSSIEDIVKITEQLDSTSSNVISTIGLEDINTGDIISTELSIFETNADNGVFFNESRIDRYERARFFNNVILMRGNSSSISLSGGHFTNLTGDCIVYPSATASFAQNSPIDQIRLAFSLISKTSSADVPDSVNILVNFTNADGSEYARFEAVVTDGSTYQMDPADSTSDIDVDFATNRYYVVSKSIDQLYKSSGFNWDLVTQVQIYSNVIDSATPSANYYVALDALRLENISSVNPLYGLTGYSIVQNTDATTVIKSQNTNNYIEFRFIIEAS